MSKTVSAQRSAQPGWVHGWEAAVKGHQGFRRLRLVSARTGMALRKQRAEAGAGPGPG